MLRRLIFSGVFLLALTAATGRTANACAECASSSGVVGCRYRFFYGSECRAWWNSATRGFECEQSGGCDEVGPPDPNDPGGPGGPDNQNYPPGIWTMLPGIVEVPEAVFARLPEASVGAISPVS